MNRFLTYLLLFLLIVAISGCAGRSQENALLDVLDGTWKSESETLNISGRRVEITGYYELNGSRVAGTVTEGTISAGENGGLELHIADSVVTGYLEDENTLVFGQITYRK